jgi:hypothetical protein
MRKLGVAILGLLGGLLAGFLLTQTAAAIVVFGIGEGRLPGSPLALLLRSLVPVVSVLGIVVALGVDGRQRRSDTS